MKNKLFKLSPATWLIAWLALSSPAQTTVLFEGFEGAFPEANGWLVGDLNPQSSPAYWNDVDFDFGSEGTRSGNWKGYCAGYGYGGSTTAPTYRNDMSAFMSRNIDLTGFTAAQLRFWHRLPSIESGYDVARVTINTNVVWSDSNTNAAWTEVTLDLTAFVGGVRGLNFWFISDSSVTGEGWYLDDIQVIGYTPPANDQCSGAISLSAWGSWTMDTGGATSTGDPSPVCAGNFGKGVWFKHVAPASGALVPVASGCNDDNGPWCSGRQASVVVQVVEGTTYYILAGGYGGATGTLQISLPFQQRLNIRQNANGSVTLDWPSGGTLQVAPFLTAPWTDVTGATSPYTLSPTSPMLFFRIRQ